MLNVADDSVIYFYAFIGWVADVGLPGLAFEFKLNICVGYVILMEPAHLVRLPILSLIYLITDRITGRMYIGKTRKAAEARLQKHINDANRPDRKQYGIEYEMIGKTAADYTVRILRYCVYEVDDEQSEKDFITLYKKDYPDKVANIHSGGKDGARNIPLSHESKKNISEGHRVHNEYKCPMYMQEVLDKRSKAGSPTVKGFKVTVGNEHVMTFTVAEYGSIEVTFDKALEYHASRLNGFCPPTDYFGNDKSYRRGNWVSTGINVNTGKNGWAVEKPGIPYKLLNSKPTLEENLADAEAYLQMILSGKNAPPRDGRKWRYDYGQWIPEGVVRRSIQKGWLVNADYLAEKDGVKPASLFSGWGPKSFMTEEEALKKAIIYLKANDGK